MKTHKFDRLSFLSGLVITAIGLLFLIPRDPSDLIDFLIDAGMWFWPVLFIAVGVAVLAPLVGRHGEPDTLDDLSGDDDVADNHSVNAARQ